MSQHQATPPEPGENPFPAVLDLLKGLLALKGRWSGRRPPTASSGNAYRLGSRLSSCFFRKQARETCIIQEGLIIVMVPPASGKGGMEVETS